MKIIIAGHSGAGCDNLALRLGRLFPEHNFQKAGFSGEVGALPGGFDGAILAVNLMDGPMPGTRGAVSALKSTGLPLFGFALTHLDEFDAQSKFGPHIKELVGIEARELASAYGFLDDGIPMRMLALIPGCEDDLTGFFNDVLKYAAERA